MIDFGLAIATGRWEREIIGTVEGKRNCRWLSHTRVCIGED